MENIFGFTPIETVFYLVLIFTPFLLFMFPALFYYLVLKWRKLCRHHHKPYGTWEYGPDALICDKCGDEI